MKVKIRYFAEIKERLNKSEETIEMDDGANVSELLKVIFPDPEQHEKMSRYLRVAINQAIQPGEAPLNDGDEIVLVEPFGGG